MSGMVLGILHILVYLILTTTRGRHYYPHFTDEEIEASKDQGTCPRSHSKGDSCIFLLGCLTRTSVGTT